MWLSHGDPFPDATSHPNQICLPQEFLGKLAKWLTTEQPITLAVNGDDAAAGAGQHMAGVRGQHMAGVRGQHMAGESATLQYDCTPCDAACLS